MKNILLLLLPFFAFNIQAQDGIKPIIDMHLHDYTVDTYYTAPSPDGNMSPKDLNTYREQTMAMLKKYNVKKAVVSTIGGTNTLDKAGVLIPGYYTNRPPADTLKFITQIKTGEIKVFGEIGAIYGGYTLSHPDFDVYMKICERYNIPIAVHTGGGPPNITYGCCPNFRLKNGDPYTIEDVIAKYPKLRIYLMHSGEVYFEHAIRLMMQYSHVYADLGVVLWVHDIAIDYGEQFLRKAKKYGLIDRVMYGSDQMVWPHAIEKSIKQLDSYEFLTEEDKRKIFYHNAVRFLGLNETDLN